MSEKIVQLNEEVIKGQLKELVRGSVEETLNELLEAEAEKLTQAARYERNEQRQGYRSGHYSRNLTTTSGDVTLKVPKLKGISFETAIIERYRRRESSVEEALIEMYLAGVSVRRVEDITEALWGSKVSPATISELNKKAYVHIEDWRNRPLQGGRYPYVYVDGIYLRRNWGGEFENVAILVAIAVNEDGYREVLGAAEGMKEDKASWGSFFQWLRSRGLDGVRLVVGDKCLGMLEAVGEVFPEAKYQRCTVHFYRNVFSVTPRSKVKLVAKMLKAIHAQESKKAAREKAKAVVEQLRSMKLKEAAKKVEDGLYMVGPFLAEYGRRYDRPDLRQQVIRHVLLMQQHTRDPKTGLWFHAWDETRTADWCDPATGLAPEFWGRSLGWVPVAILDDLEQLSPSDSGYDQLCAIVPQLLQSLCRYQGADGRWYQVVNKPEQPGNWPENSCTCLFAAALARAVLLGMLPKEYAARAHAAYDGVIRSLSWQGDDIQIGGVCVGTGVGTYDFYCGRPCSVNDLHGVGAFLLMCTAMQQLQDAGL